ARRGRDAGQRLGRARRGARPAGRDRRRRAADARRAPALAPRAVGDDGGGASRDLGGPGGAGARRGRARPPPPGNGSRPGDLEPRPRQLPAGPAAVAAGGGDDGGGALDVPGRRGASQPAGAHTSAAAPSASAPTPSDSSAAPPSRARPAPVRPLSRSLKPIRRPRSEGRVLSASSAVAATKEKFQPRPRPNRATAVAGTLSIHSSEITDSAIRSRPPKSATRRP